MSSVTIISLIYIATRTTSILKHTMGGLVSFVNLHKILNISSLLQILSLSNKHLLSLYWSCDNVAESSLLLNVLSLF